MAPKAMVHLMLLPFLLSLLPFSSLALSQDFCVANLTLPDTPSGYPCKPIDLVTPNDFYSDVLNKPGIDVHLFKMSFSPATVQQYPGLNSLGLSAARLDVAPGGAVPMHTHPEGSELIYILKGTLVAGFISSTASGNRPYVKKLREGELFLFPKGLQHFQYNVGNSTVTFIATLSNSNPGVQATSFALFGNTLPPEVVSKTTLISRPEVDRLKRLFRVASSA